MVFQFVLKTITLGPSVSFTLGWMQSWLSVKGPLVLASWNGFHIPTYPQMRLDPQNPPLHGRLIMFDPSTKKYKKTPQLTPAWSCFVCFVLFCVFVCLFVCFFCLRLGRFHLVHVDIFWYIVCIPFDHFFREFCCDAT